MRGSNAKNLKFDLIELFGVPVLFTDDRVDSLTVPKYLHTYEVRNDDVGEPCTLEGLVIVDFGGTVISYEDIPLKEGKITGSPYKTIGYDDLDWCEGYQMTLEEYAGRFVSA